MLTLPLLFLIVAISKIFVFSVPLSGIKANILPKLSICGSTLPIPDTNTG